MSGDEARSFEEFAARADAVLGAVADGGGALRLMGGVAVRMRAADLGGIDPTRRAYHDIDFVGRLHDVRVIDAAFLAAGFEPDREINTQFGTVRRVYHHPDGFHADLFLDRLEFCHTIELNGRLDRVERTLSPSDLLLAKLQIVERNEKDLIDAAWLLLNHRIADADVNALELPYLVSLTSGDWGLFTTANDFLDDVAGRLVALGLDAGPAERVGASIHQLQGAMAAAPKSMRWRARERVGRRVKWYRSVEEIL